MTSGNRQTDLSQYARAVKRRWYLVALVTVATVAAALLITSRAERLYQASSDVLVVAAVNPSEVERAPEPGRISENVAMTLRSKSISNAVAQELGFAAGVEPEYTVRVLEGTDTLRITATDADPQRAAEVANSLADVYSNQVSTQELERFERRKATLQARIDEATAAIQTFQAQRQAVLDARVAADAAQHAQQLARLAQGLPLAPGTTVPDDDLFLIDEELRLALAQRETFRDALSDLTIERDLVGGAQLRTLSAAEVPTERTGFGPAQMGVLSLVVGLVLGLATAIVRDRVAGVVSGRGDVEELLAPAPVLAVTPTLRRWRRAYPRTGSARGPRGVAAEAVRSLAVSVRLMSEGRRLRVIQVASPRERETSNVAAHLAGALAGSKHRVVLVSADVRNRARQDPNLVGAAGWTDVVSGRAVLDDVLVDVHGRLSVLPVGGAPSSQTELVGDAFGMLLRDLERSFDFVVVDSPSFASADALLITSLVDGTVLVVRAGKTRRAALDHAVDLLRQVEAPLVGAVLVGVEVAAGYSSRPARTVEDEGRSPSPLALPAEAAAREGGPPTDTGAGQAAEPGWSASPNGHRPAPVEESGPKPHRLGRVAAAARVATRRDVAPVARGPEPRRAAVDESARPDVVGRREPAAPVGGAEEQEAGQVETVAAGAAAGGGSGTAGAEPVEPAGGFEERAASEEPEAVPVGDTPDVEPAEAAEEEPAAEAGDAAGADVGATVEAADDESAAEDAPEDVETGRADEAPSAGSEGRVDQRADQDEDGEPRDGTGRDGDAGADAGEAPGEDVDAPVGEAEPDAGDAAAGDAAPSEGGDDVEEIEPDAGDAAAGEAAAAEHDAGDAETGADADDDDEAGDGTAAGPDAAEGAGSDGRPGSSGDGKPAGGTTTSDPIEPGGTGAAGANGAQAPKEEAPAGLGAPAGRQPAAGGRGRSNRRRKARPLPPEKR